MMTKQQLKQLKTATQKLSKWESSGSAFGHYKIIELKATETKGADKMYEFFCLMKIIKDLSTNYTVTLVPGTQTNKIFPEAPALKKGWPYFQIQNNADANNAYQVCYGTKIKLSKAPKTKIAPDISIQKHDASDDPDETMVELIMDAKFKFDDRHVLPVEQLHAFMQRVAALKTQSADTIKLNLNSLIDIKSNCLLTNGQALSDHHDYCQMFKIKQVERFDSNGKVYNVIG